MNTTTTTTTLPLHQKQQKHQDRSSTLIALNNLAIDLLQENEHRLAVATFQDALQLMKAEKSSSKGVVVASDILQRAQNRVTEVSSRMSSSSSTSTGGEPLVLSLEHDALDAYNLLLQKRTSKVCLRIIADSGCSDDLMSDPKLLHSILVFNYGIAHRCLAAVNSCTDSTRGGADDTRTSTFCLQIFQYAETLVPLACNNLLYRLLLTRNLMMLSCRLGLVLCEHYKETLDPIVTAILEQQEEEPQTSPNDEQPRAPAA